MVLLFIGLCIFSLGRGLWLLRHGRKSGWKWLVLMYALPLGLVAGVVGWYGWYLLQG